MKALSYMKNIILISLILIATLTNAQEIKLGVKAGLNVSNLTGNYPNENEVVDTKSKIGFHLGGGAEYSINDRVSVQAELLISTQGGSSEIKWEDDIISYSGGYYGSSFIATLKLTYLTLPIMLKYKVIDKLSIEFGPQIGYILSAKYKLAYVDFTDPLRNEIVEIEIDLLSDREYEFLGSEVEKEEGINRFDFGLNLGASYDLVGNIFLQGRYNLSLTTIDENSEIKGTNTDNWYLKNSVLQFSAGYRF